MSNFRCERANKASENITSKEQVQHVQLAHLGRASAKQSKPSNCKWMAPSRYLRCGFVKPANVTMAQWRHYRQEIGAAWYQVVWQVTGKW